MWIFLITIGFAGGLYGQEKPVTLLRGLGNYHHSITASNPEAQKFFDQGLVMLYGFNRYEALRSFQRAVELDPKALMPRWGVAQSLSPHINMDLDADVNAKKACEAARAAANLPGPEHEKAYIEAALALCQGEEAHRKALRSLYTRYPDDPDAATLFAESLMVPVRWRWWQQGKPQGEMAECIRVLEQILKRNPDHPGANHFYVHAIEMSPHPEYALPSAQRLMGGVAPGAGHLVHMAGHIYLRMGDYEIVAASNERAIQVDEEYFHHTGVHGGYMGFYYAHNQHFLAYARMMQGRFEQAEAAARKMVNAAKPFIEQAPGVMDQFVPTPWFVLLRFGKWDRMLAEPAPSNEKLPVTRAIWRYGRALALKGKGDLEKARAEQSAFEKARAAVPADALWINNRAQALLDIAGLILQARLANGDRAAIPHLRKAAALQDALVYDEPPPWYFPVRESLGAALIRTGAHAEAERTLRHELDLAPRNGRALFLLGESLRAQKRMRAAELVDVEFHRAWKHAQVKLAMADF